MRHLQGCLAHKKQLSPLGAPRDEPTAESWGGVVSCERGTPVVDPLVLNQGRIRSVFSGQGFFYVRPKLFAESNFWNSRITLHRLLALNIFYQRVALESLSYNGSSSSQQSACKREYGTVESVPYFQVKASFTYGILVGS